MMFFLLSDTVQGEKKGWARVVFLAAREALRRRKGSPSPNICVHGRKIENIFFGIKIWIGLKNQTARAVVDSPCDGVRDSGGKKLCAGVREMALFESDEATGIGSAPFNTALRASVMRAALCSGEMVGVIWVRYDGKGIRIRRTSRSVSFFYAP